MQNTGNTLAPGYNTVNPAETTGVFDVNRFAEHQPELTAEITPTDTVPQIDNQPNVGYLRAVAESRAIEASAALNQEAVAPAPVREGEINYAVDRQNIGVNAGAIDVIREDILARAAALTPKEMRHQARWN